MSSTDASPREESDDERAPLLDVEAAPKVTPLPRLQLFVAIFIQIAEPVTCSVIYPFVNDLIRDLGVTGGDEKKTGYYVGVVESIFYAAEALTVMHWGKASDIVGRKPILLGGMAGLTLSMFSFGLSKRYWMLLATRCAQGAFNGNVGVTKSVMAEITDATNAPQAFAFLPVAWSIGTTVGPAIGGIFAKPAEQWPEVFGKIPFFKEYPYFLPCLMAALFPVLALLIGLVGLKETCPTVLRKRRKQARLDADSESSSLLSPTPDSSYGSTSSTLNLKSDPDDIIEPKPTFRSIFIPQVLIPITNFMFLAYLDQCLIVLIPLVWSTPISYGGLDLPPSQIGTILGVFGLLNGAMQIFFFAKVRGALGHRVTYTMGLFGLVASFAMFPVQEWLVKIDGGRAGTWVYTGIVAQLFFYSLSFMSYACMFMYVGASAPNRASLGTTNGLAQLSSSGVRAIAPTTASSLFSLSLSLRNGSLGGFGGYTVYIFIQFMALGALMWSRWLPKEL